MANKSLLIFPRYEDRDPPKGHGGPPNLLLPNKRGQAERITERFKRVIAELTDGVTGDIEKVLVIETIGKVRDFHKAVVKIHGLEWLAEIDEDDIEIDWEILYPDINEGERKKIKENGGRLYLSMSNEQAAKELVGLWNKWKRGKKLKHGYGMWKTMFKQIKNLRFWNQGDMFRESGFENEFFEDIEKGESADGKTSIDFEVEFHFRADEQKRNKAAYQTRDRIETAGGAANNEVCLPEIRFHAIKVTLPILALEPLINNGHVECLSPDTIRYCRPMSLVTEEEEVAPTRVTQFIPKPCNSELPPVIALLDGVPIVRHSLLDNRLLLDDPDDYTARYGDSKNQKHGTAMASVICHGDTKVNLDSSLLRRIYMRPVLEENKSDSKEGFPTDVFPADVTMRAVRRMFDGENGEPPVAPTVRVINLSLGNSKRIFLNEISPWARVLDYLSSEYNVLFIVSAGNQMRNIKMEPSSLLQVEKAIRGLDKESIHWRIIEPAEAINALTIGAANKDEFPTHHPNDNIDLLEGNPVATLYSRIGHGFRGQIKPDLIVAGGKMHYRQVNPSSDSYRISKEYLAQGLEHAYPDEVSPEVLDRCRATSGTSNSAALVTHVAGEIYEILEELRNENRSMYDEKYDPLLIKALLVHGATRTVPLDMNKFYRNILEDRTPRGTRWNRYISKFVGYGTPDFERTKECTDFRVTSLGFGEIEEKRLHVYTLPVPSICKESNFVKLIVTLAWFSPISPNRQLYRNARLSFAIDPQNGERGEYDFQQVKKGTLQHEIFHLDPFSMQEDIGIEIMCNKDAVEHLDQAISYGLAVTIEVADNIAIYEEIRNQFAVISPIPAS